MAFFESFRSSKSNEDKVKSFLVVLISDSSVQSAFASLDDKGVKVLERSRVIDYSDQKELLTQTDKSLQELGKESENVKEVIFGLEADWVTKNNGLVAERKPLLKKLTEELSLTAVGFVVISEALNHHLINKDPHFSALVVRLTHLDIETTLVKQSQVVGSIKVGRSGNIVADVTEALARLGVVKEDGQTLPAKIFIASIQLKKDDLAKEQQVLLSHDWLKTHPFIQAPVIELIEENIVIDALAEQGGTAIKQSKGAPLGVPPKAASKTSPGAAAPTTIAKGDNFGFIEPDLQSRKASEAAGSTAVETAKPPQGSSVSSFGVPIPSDQLPAEPKDTHAAVKRNSTQTSIGAQPQVSSVKKKNLFISRLSHWFVVHKRFAFFGFALGLVTLFSLSYFWLHTGVSAQITLELVGKDLNKDLSIVLDPDLSESDYDNQRLAATRVSKEINGQKIGESTGVKLVGDKATGKVELLNKTDDLKTFAAGTTIKKGQLVFTLDREVTVASSSVKQSSSSSETKEYGKVEVEVTATEIGAEQNLAKETELTVESFDSGTFSAVVSQSLTGGASREIRVVSPSDREDLLAELQEELLKIGLQELSDESDEGIYLVSTNKFEVVSSEFEGEVGDEQSTLSLDLTLELSALSYRASDLRPLAEAVLSAEIPPDYQLSSAEPQILSTPSDDESSSDLLSLEANLSSQAVPIIDFESLKNEIKGQPLKNVSSDLQAKEAISQAEVHLQPLWVERLISKLPSNLDKIEIIVKE